MRTRSQKDPVPEAVKNMIPPDQSGVSYVAKRYIVEALTAGNANAFAFAVQNPEGVDCVVTNVVVDLTTAGTGDSIIDGLDINQTGTFDRHKNAGTNGGAPLKWDKVSGKGIRLTNHEELNPRMRG